MVSQAPAIICPTNLLLKRATVSFADHKPPTTASEWFSARFPVETEQYGCPFLESQARIDGYTCVTALEMNNDFMAVLLGGDQRLGHHVCYFQPEHQFYFKDSDGLFKPTTEEKLKTVLSTLLMRCAEELPSTCNRIPLVVDFRQDERLTTVVKKARSILAADSTFFSADSTNRRTTERSTPQTTAKRFILSAVRPDPNHLLSIQDCFTSFAGYCKNHGVEAVERRYFKKIIAEVIREEFGVALRGDLKDQDGRYLRGWRGLTVEPNAVARN